MKIIEPSVEYWKQGDNVKAHVAKCARVCYGKESGNDDVTINTLLKKHHWSMFRHESVYAIIPVHERELKDYPLLVLSNPYIKTHTYNGNVYVATNGQFILDKLYPKFIELINMYRVTEDEFSNTEFGFDMMRYTFCVITQISTSRELNRVSPNNISEQSTRYVYENGSICRPYWVSTIEAEMFNKDNNVNLDDGIELFLSECNNSFNTYKFLIDQYNFSRQDARGVLPFDTATKCVYTYSIDEWRHIIKLRTDKAAHPNAQIIANMIKKELEGLGYEFN
ncbi:FAD-dependent thymidylate synthase [Paraprevotella clara]|uniref:FAD-dependent thymidylate synthase n=1 Tax=Paraprevotella clara TaxID=454154 RepID=UPI00266FB265|nr:FAD-dependent thymidylate synthase [Paraprevotella clara]